VTVLGDDLPRHDDRARPGILLGYDDEPVVLGLGVDRPVLTTGCEPLDLVEPHRLVEREDQLLGQRRDHRALLRVGGQQAGVR
jgi:hypothetical protein